MPNTQLQLIEELHLLYLQEKREEEFSRREKELLQREKELERHSREIVCSATIEKLCQLYKQEKEQLYNEYIHPFIEVYSFLNETTILTYIGKEEEENYHSKLLSKLWNCQTETGHALFTDFLKLVDVEKEWLQIIEKGSYTIKMEQPTGKYEEDDEGRVDLFFRNDKYKWLICIENKINSKVYANKRSGRCQLEIYEAYCKREYPGYKQLYILLSYSNNKSYVRNHAEWKYTDYYAVMKSLLKYSESNKVIQDYLKVLYFLLFRREHFDDQLYNEKTSLCVYNSFINRIISKIH